MEELFELTRYDYKKSFERYDKKQILVRIVQKALHKEYLAESNKHLVVGKLFCLVLDAANKI